MNTITCLLTLFVFHHYLCSLPHPARCDGAAREALEIIIGGGYPAPPSYDDCPPPPPPEPECPPPPPPEPECPPPPPPEPECPPPPPPPKPKPTPSPPPPKLKPLPKLKPPPPPPKPKPKPPPGKSSFESERLKLVYPVIQKLKTKIKGDPLGITKSWVGTNICKNYKGFSCGTVPSYSQKALAVVNFNGFNFTGPDLTLSGFLEELPDVTIFHANSNKFLGGIPQKVTQLNYLFELDVSNNHLSGDFPNEVLAATNLTFLDLRFNSFAGIVPPQVFNLRLDVLFINDNNFVQMLPYELGSTSALYLTFANNKFVGPIPQSIGQASKSLLEVIFLNNQLSGCLPPEIGLLDKSTVFDVSRNLLTGPIPLSFGCLEKMEYLNLANNQFYGAVPEQVCKLNNLVNLTLSDNYFTQVGAECRKLIERKVLDVGMNCILDLPMQRSPEKCAAFFSKPHHCPDERSLLKWSPCAVDHNPKGVVSEEQTSSVATAPAASSTPPVSYSALLRHRLL